jgi:hypothetical protein
MQKRVSLLLLFMLAAQVVMLATGISDTTAVVDSTAAAADAAADSSGSSSGPDVFELVIIGAYLLGVFLLLPLVIFTNLNEKIKTYDPNKHTDLDIQHHTEEERNQMAIEILERIEERLSFFTADDGSEMVTITKGKQARFMKRGLDYINVYLQPNDEEVIARVNEFSQVYYDRTNRSFTGSKWIIGAAAGILVFMGIIEISMLWSSFALIHLLGLVFYILSSRTPKYAIEKRENTFGSKKLGIAGGVFAALFAGFATREYVSVNGGPWRRDYEGEFSSGMVLIFIIFVVAILVAFLVALFGIINFLMNYSTSFLLPFKTTKGWYEKNFQQLDLNQNYEE